MVKIFKNFSNILKPLGIFLWGMFSLLIMVFFSMIPGTISIIEFYENLSFFQVWFNLSFFVYSIVLVSLLSYKIFKSI